MIKLFSLEKEEMKNFCQTHSMPRWRADQIWQWLYNKKAKSFSEMTSLSKELRGFLEETCTITMPHVETKQVSTDGTIKWLFRLSDGNLIETVLIPELTRKTLCISSQVGCILNCTFCHTGTQKYIRNLEADEIIGQVAHACNEVCDITNIVFMGMGEPFFNYDNFKKASLIMADQDGLAFSKRKITVSTAGVVPCIYKLADEIGIRLAISLHAPRDDLRSQLIPLNRKYPIIELIEACRYYSEKHPHKRVTFEYVMLENVNDSRDDAKKLVRLLGGINSGVNLIPFNDWSGTIYKSSSMETILAFGSIIKKAGFPMTIRAPRGVDIMAACGQLKSVYKL